ncbi:MAG: sulfotransferase [Flavobacteriales bacterium]
MGEKPSHIPELIIGGAPKCGTSSLFFWLAAHPSICPSRKKETHFLRDRIVPQNRELNIHQHGIEAYRELFPSPDKGQLRTEATPSYLYENTALKVLSKASPHPYIVFILRDPVERVHSRYRFARYRRKQIQISFHEFLNTNAEALNWRIHPVEQSRYSKYLKPWTEHFDKERLKVYLFEDLKADPKAFMKKLSRDIGIDPAFYENYDPAQRNSSKKVRSKWLHRLGERLQPLIPSKVQEQLLPLYLKINTGETPPMSEEEIKEKEHLEKEFKEEFEGLKELFPKLDLSPWEEKAAKKD